MKKFIGVFALSLLAVLSVTQALVRAQGESKPWKGDGGAVIQPSAAAAAGGGGATPTPTFLRATYTWTNADIVGCGAVLDCNLSAFVAPAKARIETAHMVLSTTAVGPTTLTASVGRVGTAFVDLLTAGNMKAANGTLYGDASAEVGTSVLANGYLTNWSATSDFRIRFLATGANLDTVTGCTGYVIIDYYVYP